MLFLTAIKKESQEGDAGFASCLRSGLLSMSKGEAMAWNKITHCNLNKACVACGYSGDSLEIYSQSKGLEPLGQQHWQHCAECGCVTIFYLDERLGEYYGQLSPVFKLVDLEAFDEMRRMNKGKVN